MVLRKSNHSAYYKTFLIGSNVFTVLHKKKGDTADSSVVLFENGPFSLSLFKSIICFIKRWWKKYFEEVSQELLAYKQEHFSPSAQSAIENGCYRFWCETVITFLYRT